MADLTFEQIKILVEQMPPTEIARLRTWINNLTEPVPTSTPGTTWGERLVALVNEFDLDESDQMDIPDPEAWVREHRRAQSQQRNPGWGSE